MGLDASRVYFPEGAGTYTQEELDKLILEIDMRTTGANVFIDVSRTSGLISQIDYYSDVGRTTKIAERAYTRAAGIGGVLFVIQVITKFFNANGSEDSRVTETFTRDADDLITACDSVFSTTEDTKI